MTGSLIEKTKVLSSWAGFCAEANHATIWNSNVEKVFKKLVESVICVADDQNFLPRVVMESLREQCTNERFSSPCNDQQAVPALVTVEGTRCLPGGP